MGSAGAPHPKQLDFVIDREKLAQLEAADLVASIHSVVEGLFRDIEKFKSLGLEPDTRWLDALKAAREEREYRRSEDFQAKVWCHLNGD